MTNKGAKIRKADFEGKTIKRLDIKAVNSITFTFEDGTKATLEVVVVLPSAGLYGIEQTREGFR